MANIERGIQTILTYARDDSKGYELFSGNHYTYEPGTDCAGLVRMYAASAEGVALASYPDFGTWNERRALTSRGWAAIVFSRSKMKRGDVLLRAKGDSTGHTVVYTGNNTIIGAEGNWDGRRGDSSGAEICVRSYYDFDYDYILRPPADKPIEEVEVPKVNIEKVDHGVYRLYNPNDEAGNHLYTVDHSEAEYLANHGWTYEGADIKYADSGVQLYRLYNPFSGEHMYVRDHEAAELGVKGWVIEGYAWVAPETGRAVYRLYNGVIHHWTTSEAECASLKESGWADEGIAFYSA